MPTRLRVEQHDRDAAGLTYVYPVVSRRARGLSIGVNLNPNNACNYRCIYCQVPGLTFGKGPAIDLPLLEQELRGLLKDVLDGDFMEQQVPEDSRRLNDVAFSGNGEPTSSPDFAAAVDLVGNVLESFGLVGKLKVVLITNGTLVDKPEVEAGIARMKAIGGEVWFKLDSATREGSQLINDNGSSMEARIERLQRVASVCPTWLQTCVLAIDGSPPSEAHLGHYLELVARLRRDNVPLAGVLLYGLSRPSMQPEAPRLSKVSEAFLEAFASRIAALGVTVSVSP
jgi:wyosine [tRNA(Phe)-imidazoG37] synthetase (radical SAM superfamily)